MPTQLVFDSNVCIDLVSIINTNIYPLSAVAGLLAGLVIAGTYMFGESTQNPKSTSWAKSEFIQLIVSAFSVFLILQIISATCTAEISEISALTAADSLIELKNPQNNVFGGAFTYLAQSADFSRKVMKIQRYHLQAFNMLEARGRWECVDFVCLFGSSGLSTSPYAGLSMAASGFNFSFNSSLISYLSSLNYLFILLFAYSGMALFLIPLGIFLRSMPFLRGFGTLLISISLCFLVIYPLILIVEGFAAKNLMVIPENLDQFVSEGTVISAGSSSAVAAESFDFGSDDYIDRFFDSDDPSKLSNTYTSAISLAGISFLVSVFFPTVAMLATIASIRQVGRLLGEEIDLSRIIQMV